jgi:hypothetical protein
MWQLTLSPGVKFTPRIAQQFGANQEIVPDAHKQ